jgi:outer membrane usher protein FimD/PapC
MDTTSLPENVDVDNGFAQLVAGRGLVSKINFHILNVRRVMMYMPRQRRQCRSPRARSR